MHTNRIYGYVRVSAKDQNTDRQYDALHKENITDDFIYTDKISGKSFDRPAYLALLKKLRKGDTLYIKSIDRLGRNYNEILEQWRLLTKEKEVSIVVLDMPLLNTNQDRDLTNVLIADIFLQLLSYVAETERNFIRRRQREGIEAAKQRGRHLGRRAKEIPPEFPAVMSEWQEGRISAREAGRKLSVNHMTFLKWARNGEEILPY